jgi:serine/threonine protein kinase
MVATAKQATPDDLVGRVIEDRYEVLRKLGDSQLGRVYEAKHVTLERVVMLEVLGTELASSEAARACFLHQARQASRLRHRGIVEVEHQGVTPNGSVYVASEPVQGTTLEAVLRRETKLPWSRARGIGLQIAAALRAAHRRSVVHQGLRPAVVHLWIEEDGSERVKLAGFGMIEVGAQAQRQLEVEGATTRLLGDGRYMPPEQVPEGRGSVQGDVYALGAVLYQMLTGEPPVPRTNTLQVMTRELVPARRKEPTIPMAVEASLVRALAMEAGDRPESVHELERELEEVAADAVGHEEEVGTEQDAVTREEVVASGDGSSEVGGPPMLVSSRRAVLVQEEEGTTMLERSHVAPREESTTMFERLPTRRDSVPVVEATEILAVGKGLVMAPSVHASVARPPGVAAHQPVLAATPAPLIARSATPVFVPVPTTTLAQVSAGSRAVHGPATMTSSASSPARVRSFEPMIGRPLPDAVPPDRTWLVAVVAAVLVAVSGMVIGVVLANASQPEREEREEKPSKAVQKDRRK